MPKAKKSPFDLKSEMPDSNTSAIIETDYMAKLEKYCAYQDRCRFEVIQKMRRLMIPEKYHNSLIIRLEQHQFIDEKRYAMVFARSKFNLKAWGPERIRIELQQRKIDPETINDALAQLNIEDKLEKLKGLLIKYQRSVKAANALQKKNKILRFGMSKGYTYSDVGMILKELEKFE